MCLKYSVSIQPNMSAQKKMSTESIKAWCLEVHLSMLEKKLIIVKTSKRNKNR